MRLTTMTVVVFLAAGSAYCGDGAPETREGGGIFGLFAERVQATLQRATGEAPQAAPADFPPDTPWFRIPAELRAEFERVLEPQVEPNFRSDDRAPIAEEYYDESFRAWQAAREEDPQLSWSRYFFDTHLGIEGRRVLLCVQAKMAAEHIWHQIAVIGRFDPASPWPGFWAAPRDPSTFLAYLGKIGYGDWFGADRGDRWGLRSPDSGAQFHILGPASGGDPRMNEFHIDLSNPGDRSYIDFLSDAYHGLDHLVNDHPDFGADSENISERLREDIVDQGIEVHDPDLVSLEGAWISDFLKWETDEDDWFGYMWMNPREGTAGWWTEEEGARNFDRVILVSEEYPVTYRLEYGNGSLELLIFWDSIEASWYQKSSGKYRHFEGEKIRGFVFKKD